MQISELKITKNLSNNISIDNAINTLADHGWAMLGKGVEGAVAEHPGKVYVLKLYKNDSKYTHFVNLVQHFPNIHFPRFSRFVRVVPGTTWNYVRMEKLTSINQQSLMKNHLPEMVSLVNICYIHGLDCPQTYDVNFCLRFRTRDIRSKNPELGSMTAQTENQDRIQIIYQQLGRKPDEAWVTAVTKCCERAKSLNLQMLDLHYANFMVRGDCLVIADPYWR